MEKEEMVDMEAQAPPEEHPPTIFKRAIDSGHVVLKVLVDVDPLMIVICLVLSLSLTDISLEITHGPSHACMSILIFPSQFTETPHSIDCFSFLFSFFGISLSW